jgi:hypothetical protein
MEPRVIDDFLPPPLAQSIYQLLEGPEIKWQFGKTSVEYLTSEPFFNTDVETKDSLQFRHTFMRSNEIVSDFYKYITPVVEFYEMHTSSKISYTQRIKANMLFNHEGIKPQLPHTDAMEIKERAISGKIWPGRTTLLYYVNNSDGDTIFYNERFTGQPIGKLTEQMRVSPKKNRAVIFDSSQLHSACKPTNKNYRIVLNCIFGGEPVEGVKADY